MSPTVETRAGLWVGGVVLVEKNVTSFIKIRCVVR
jgi:hypothetical protein